MSDPRTWNISPPLSLSNPVLASLADRDGLWAGGLGGVAWFSEATGWDLRSAGLPVRPVHALALGGSYLLAGGEGGIARSPDRGLSWQPCLLPAGSSTITNIALSPAFLEDGTALAATLGSGILRSSDAGRTWQSANFGLRTQDVLALTWRSGDEVVAATDAGLYVSPNSGRAWRVESGTDEVISTSLAVFPDGMVFAATYSGQVLRSEVGSTAWTPLDGMPREVGSWTLATSPAGTVLLGSPDRGIWRSDDRGVHWFKIAHMPVLSLTISGKWIVVGTFDGFSQSEDGGSSWSRLPPTPLHDLHRLHVFDGCVLLTGTDSPPQRSKPDGGWMPLKGTPGTYSGTFMGPDGALFAGGPDGLVRSDDLGTKWKTVVTGLDGNLTHMTFMPDGRGWAGLTPDGELLRAVDSGRSWVRLGAPFGVLPLVALQAYANPAGRAQTSLTAATYDQRLSVVTVWRSDDEGETWHRGGDTRTDWPVVATCGDPPVITIANVITVKQPDGSWRQTPVGQTGIRRVVSDGKTLFALAGDALWRSDDFGASWERDDAGLPIERVADIALDDGRLYVFVAPDKVWERSQ